MSSRRVRLRLFLDEGVPDSVGEEFRKAGHQVTVLRKSGIATGSPDQLVCTFAEINDSILVAFDGDMKQLARGHGVTLSRFKKLSLIKLSCFEPTAAERVKGAMTLIEHEWRVANKPAGERRIFIEIGDNVIRTAR